MLLMTRGKDVHSGKSFTRLPRIRRSGPTVSGYMTEATRKDGWAVTLGPYTYIPAPAHSSATVNGTLTRGGCPVALQVTEPVLRDFIDAMSTLEKDLARRWISATDWSAFALSK